MYSNFHHQHSHLDSQKSFNSITKNDDPSRTAHSQKGSQKRKNDNSQGSKLSRETFDDTTQYSGPHTDNNSN